MLLDPLQAMTLIGLEALERYRGPLTTDVQGEAHYHDRGDQWPEDVDYDDRLPTRSRGPLAPEVLEAFDADSMPPGEEEVF